MNANRRLHKSLSLIILAAMLLGLVVSPAAAQESVVLAITGGDNQSAVIGTAYAEPLQVAVTSLGVPVVGAVVQFDAPRNPGEASLVPDSFTATTGANGVASVAVTANVYEGPMEVTASYGGQTAVFHLSNSVLQTVMNPNPYVLESYCAFNDGAAAHDPAANRNARVCTAQPTKMDCEQYWFCWWRDTEYQNALGEQTVDLQALVTKVHETSSLTVMFYRAGPGPYTPIESRANTAANLVAIVGSSEMVLVGAGGDQNGANNAKIAFQRAYSGFMQRQLKGIILTSIDPQVTRGVAYWRNLFGDSVPMILSSAHQAAKSHRDAVDAAKIVRDTFVYGRNLTWGVDSFLGMGGYRDYSTVFPGIVQITDDDWFISEETTISVNGIPITVTPTLDEIGGLSVWLPDQEILIPCDLFGPYLPPIAPLNGRYLSIDEVMQTLNHDRALEPVYLLWQHGNYVSGAQDVNAALTVEYNALNYIRSRTLVHISYGSDVDDIVTVIQLPPNLANSPYAQPWLQDVPSIVRSVYHDYLGWFDGDPASLNTLSSEESALRFIDLAGGENAVLQAARQAITEHTRNGAQWALEILRKLRLVYPSADASDLYQQALTQLGFTTKNAPQRNWYLTEVRLALIE